jgi:hypothetical protein
MKASQKHSQNQKALQNKTEDQTMITTITKETQQQILSHLTPLLELLRCIDNDEFSLRECYVEAIYEFLRQDGQVEDEDSFLYTGGSKQ